MDTISHRSATEESLARKRILLAELLRKQAARPASFPLSFAQQRLWFLNQLAPDSPFYNISRAILLTGQLQKLALEFSLNTLVQRHEVLRTRFALVDGRQAQLIEPAMTLQLALADLSCLSTAERETAVQHLSREEARRPFDLARGLLLRACLLCLGPDEHLLLLSMHHIISDGWSMGVLFRELGALYAAFSEGRPSPLPDLPLQYADYTLWQRDWLSGAALQEQLNYWKERMADLPQLSLPTDRPRPTTQTFTGAYEPFRLSPTVTTQLKAVSQRVGATLFMALLAAFAALLARYSGQEDIVLGTGIANRTRKEFENLIGFFVNTLVLRSDLSGDPTMRELLGRIREVALGAYAHQDLPFEQLVEELHPQRDLSQNPLFQVILALQNAPYEPLSLAGLQLQLSPIHSGSTKFDIHLSLWEEAGGLSGLAEYSTDLFDASTIRRMLGHYQQALAALAAHPEQRVSTLELLTEYEREQLQRWNATRTDYPRDACLHALFEQQVERRPEVVALHFEDEMLTYDLLNARSNQLARALSQADVQAGDLVGLFMERSLDLVISMLAILKAGAAYVPLDLAYPAERISFMMQDTRMMALLTQGSLLEQLLTKIQAPDLEIFCVDGERERLERQAASNAGYYVPAAALAYVMYTSGSTGTPKGVSVTHRNVARLVKNTDYAALTAEETFLQLASISFDASTLEIWGSLLNGARLVIFPPFTPTLHELAQGLDRYQVTTLWLTAGLFHQMVEDQLESLCRLRQLLAGGDVLSVAHVQQVLAQTDGQLLINGYGPTENTTFTCCFPMQAGQNLEVGTSIPIGRPIANTQVYVVDRYGQLAPVGVSGELYIGGDGLARGYLRRPDLTSERFVPHPWSTEPGARLYKTGDLARQRPDGVIEFLGRRDQQVKIRGFRVELGEIETILNQHPAVRESVALLRDDTFNDGSGETGQKRLIAYVVPDVAALQAQSQAMAAEEPLSSQHVNHWQMIFDEHIYGQAQTPQDPTFHIAGWNSSVSGLPFSAQEMHIWLDDTIATIRSLHPRRVLEIGCGTGLLLFRIAPLCERYHGTDISRTSLAYVQQQLGRPQFALPQVSLSLRPADDLSGFEPGSFDTILLNSVVQYFPDVDYFLRVLDGALSLLAPGGHLFLGDVRSLPLLEVFHTEVALEQAPPALSREQLRKQIQQALREEDELALDPALFTRLAQTHARVSQARVMPKHGRYTNELSQFRYQVVIRGADRVGATPPEQYACDWLDWQDVGMSLATLRALLQREQPALLGLQNVPNARLARPLRALQLLSAESGPFSVEWLRATARVETTDGVEPEDLWGLSSQLPYQVAMSWVRHSSDGSFDALLYRQEGDEQTADDPALHLAQAFPHEQGQRRSWRDYANWPLQSSLSQSLLLQLRPYAQQRLPDYMLPAAWIVLEQLPLTANGKLDRRSLPPPEGARPELEQAYVAPRIPLEELLVALWAETLGLEQVGIHDNFFDLGGHSLLATQVIVRIRETLQRDVPLRILFEHPTVARLAQALQATLRLTEPQTSIPPLQPRLRPTTLPLSFAQERLWFLTKLEPDAPVYIMSSAFSLSGALRAPVLARSFNELVRRHEILRTRFVLRQGNPSQVLDASQPAHLPVIDVSALAEHARQPEAQRLSEAIAQQPFNLETGPLLRATLLRLATTEHILVLSMHHLISDGWSLSIFFRELSAIYRLYGAAQSNSSAARPVALPPLPLQYADYTLWLRDWLRDSTLQTQLAYWKQRLANLSPLSLPTDFPRPMAQRFQGRYYRFSFTPELTAALKRLSQRAGVTLFMTLLSGFSALLARYSGQRDIVIGTPIANRMHSELEGLIGLFVNTLVLRIDLSGDPSVHELLRRVRHRTLEAYAYQDTPFEKLVEELKPERTLNANPLFQVIFALQNTPSSPLALSGVQAQPLALEHTTSHFDLMFNLFDEAGALTGGVQYDQDLFTAATIERLLAHYQQLLAAMAAHPAQRLSQLQLLTDVEQAQLRAWNATQIAYPQHLCLHEWFELRARQTPEAVALAFEDQQVSYAELNRRANQLAHYLRLLGIGPEAPVGLCVDRSLDMVIGILGILKAGGAYVPLDPDYPAERLAFMLEDSQAALVITKQLLAERLAGCKATMHCLDLLEQALATQSIEAPATRLSHQNLAYIIYTSGSTGRPKGVCCRHGGVLNLLADFTRRQPLIAGEGCSFWTSFSFDVSIYEIFSALLAGGRLVIAPEYARSDGKRFMEWLHEQRIHSAYIPAFMLADALDQLRQGNVTPPLQRLLVGVEPIAEPLLAELSAGMPALRIINGYGPTEASICATLYSVDARSASQRNTPIGRPAQNTSVYLLDADLQQVPVGIAGELYIGGSGLARGYLRRPDLTAERFIPHPFSAEAGARLYRTGDLARYLPDGNIVFLGRADTQVKLRGYRIELGEIETLLAQHAAVQEAVVILREDRPGDKRLVAYLVVNEQRPGHSELQRFLKASLPEYMVPAIYVFLDALPLNANGKLDRRSLPPPSRTRDDQEAAYVAPQNPFEELLAALWASILDVEKVGIHDNFFAAGGHSLLAIRLLTQIAEALQVKLSVRDIFEAPTVAGQSLLIVQKRAEQADSETLAALMAELEQMSEEETQACLDLAQSQHGEEQL